MAQVTVYFDEETAGRMRRAARAAGVSQSRWLAELVRRRTATDWPAAVSRLAGAWRDAPSAEGLRRKQRRDAPRERF
jgi:hypothetical protein